MAIIQISKIQHRTGANVDLPQLAEGELGFATDERRLYIGNDPNLFPPSGNSLTTQTEVLTEVSVLNWSKIGGTANTQISLNSPVNTGQVLVANANTWVNAGGTSNLKIDLGTANNVVLRGGLNGYVLTTDGAGNLSWEGTGVGTFRIQGITKANPAVVTTINDNTIVTGIPLTIIGVSGMPEIAVSGENNTNKYYGVKLTNKTFSIYSDPGLANAVNSTGFVPAVANTGNIICSFYQAGTGTPGGANTQIQFQDTAGLFGGSANLTFNKDTSNLSLTGNANITRITTTLVTSANLTGSLGLGTGNAAPANFTTVNANSSISATGNITGGNLRTTGQISAGGVITSAGLNTLGNANIGNLSLTGVVKGNLIPEDDLVQNLGSPTQRWKELYLSGNTIYLGNTSITANANGIASNVLTAENANLGNLVNANFISAIFTTDSSAQPNITSVGTLTGLDVNGITNLGDVSNVRITGGYPDYTLITDGTGNLSWSPIVLPDIVAGLTNQIQYNINDGLAASANLTFNPLTNILQSTTISATGNLNSANLNVSNNIVSNSNIRGATISSTGSVTANGNIQGANLIATTQISTAGNISANNVNSNNVSVLGNVLANNLNAASAINSNGTVSGANITTAGRVSANGNVVGANLFTSGNVSAVGTLIGQQVNSGNISVSGNVTTNNLIVTNEISTTGNISSDNYILGNGAFLTGINLGNQSSLNQLTNGTSNVSIPSINGEIRIGSGGTANVVRVNNTGLTVIGNITANGTLSAGNLSSEGLSANGNVSGGNLVTSGNLSVSGNANVGPLGVAGGISVGGTVSAASAAIAGQLTANGNILGQNANLGNLVRANFFQGDGSLLTNLTIGAGTQIINGNSNVTVAANGNVGISAGGVSNVELITPQGVTVTGTHSVTGNITGANLFTTGVVSASGNLIGANVSTTGFVSASGNILGFNITAAGNLSVTGNISSTSNITAAGNFVANNANLGNANVSGVLSITGIVANGNVVGANVNSAGNISATANVNTTGLSASGNATIGGNLQVQSISATGAFSTTANITGANANLGNSVTANFFLGNLRGNLASGTNTFIIPSTNAINFTVNNTQNVVVISQNSFAVTGLLTANTSNVSNLNANNANITSLNATSLTTSAFNVTGNILTTNIQTGNLSVTGNANLPLTTISNTLTVNGASFLSNISANGSIVASANIQSNILNANTTNIVANATVGNLITGGLITANGNITGANLTSTGNLSVNANISTANITIANRLNVGNLANVANLISTSNISAFGTIQSNALNANTLTINSSATVNNLAVANFVQSNLIPNVGNTYDLGTPANSYRSLAVSNVGVAIGQTSLTSNVNQLTINAANTIISSGIINDLTVGNLANLGSVANLRIFGGNNNEVLVTNGSGNLSFSNITAVIPAAGSNTSIQFNDNGFFGASSALTFNKSNGVTSGTFSGNASRLFGIPGANVTGQVPNAAVATTVTFASQANITAVGNLTSLSVVGNLKTGNANLGNFATANFVSGILTTPSQNNITDLGNLNNLTVSNITGNVNFEYTANVALGQISNLRILGGNAGQILSTDGVGNLSWLSPTATRVANGLSAINIQENANIEFTVAGFANRIRVEQSTFASNVNAIFNEAVNFFAPVNLGSIANLRILGGQTGQVLTTTGNAGLIGWASAPATQSIVNGSSNIIVGANTNIRVGVAGTPNVTQFTNTGIITSTVSATGIVNTGLANLGNISNVRIQGGNANNIIITDGSGNLSFAPAPIAPSISNGQSNITIDLSGNVRTSVAGNANVFVVANSGITVTGKSNLGPIGNVTITGGAANQLLSTDGTGNLSWVASPPTSQISNGTSSVNIQNINGPVNIVATGVTSAIFSNTGVSVTGSLTANGNILTDIAKLKVTGGIANQVLTVVDANGNLTFGSLPAANQIVGGNSNVVVNPNANVTISVQSVANVFTVTATGVRVAGELSLTGNANLANIDSLNIPGGNAGDIITTDGVGNLSFTTPSIGTAIANGSSNVRIPINAGNINFGVSGTPNVLVISPQLANLNGNLSVTGNISSNSNLNLAGALSAAGTVTGQNIATAGTISATGNISTSASLSVTGTTTITGQLNIGSANLGNLLNGSGNISVTGNINGNNIIGNALSTTGNINGANITASANANVGNLYATNLVSAAGNIASGNNILASGNISAVGTITGNQFVGNGALLTNVTANVARIANGVSNINIPVANGNISVTVGGASVATISPGNFSIAPDTGIGGNLSVFENITAGNRVTANVLSAAGNITGAFLFGNGAFLTGVNTNVYNDGNVANFLPNYTGNLGNVTNINASGIINTSGLQVSYLSVSSAANLTTSRAGALVDVVNSSYNITLPTPLGNPGVNFTFRLRQVGQLVTLVTPSGTFEGSGYTGQGSVIISFAIGQYFYVYSDGSKYIISARIESETGAGLRVRTGTQSSSTTTGALVVTGGMGVSGNIFSGGNATIAGALSINGSFNSPAANITQITGNIFGRNTSNIVITNGDTGNGEIVLRAGGSIIQTINNANVIVNGNITASNGNISATSTITAPFANITGNVTTPIVITNTLSSNASNSSNSTLSIFANSITTGNVTGNGSIILGNLLGLHANGNITNVQNLQVGNVNAQNITAPVFNTGNVSVSGNVVANGVIHSNNVGTGNNFRVGNSVWLGDRNVVDTLAVRGQQNDTVGYITFGSDSTAKLGRSGTAALTWNSNLSVGGTITANNFVGNINVANTDLSANSFTSNNFYGGNFSGRLITTVTGNNSVEMLRANIAGPTNADYFSIDVGGTSQDSGFVSFNTGDNGAEPIYFRQYNGPNIQRQVTLLDASGNTVFPGNISTTGNVAASNLIGNLTAFVSAPQTANIINATMAGSDYFRVQLGGPTSDNGYVAFDVGDEGSEEVFFRQFTGANFATELRRVTLLNSQGNAVFPNQVSAVGFLGTSVSISGTVTAASLVGNISTTGNITANNFVGNVSGTNANLVNLFATSFIQAPVIGNAVSNHGGNVFSGNTVSVTGTVSGASLSGNLSASLANVISYTGNNASLTANITANNFISTSTGTGNNFVVGNRAFIGDANVADAVIIKGQNNPANGYIIFGTGNNSQTLGRAGTGPLTYTGNISANGTITANNFIGNFTFANVDVNANSFTSNNFFGGNFVGTLTTNTIIGSNTFQLISSNIANNDYFRVIVGGTGTDQGFVSFDTGDQGNEPIYFRQYNGANIEHQVTILDANGVSRFEDAISNSFRGNLVSSPATSTSEVAIVSGTMAGTDSFRILLGAISNTTNRGIVSFDTGDGSSNTNAVIQFRQFYGNGFTTVQSNLTLLDQGGDTSIPGNVSIAKSLSVTGNINVAGTFTTGNVSATSNITTPSLTATTITSNANIFANNISATGNIRASNDIITTQDVQASRILSTGNITATGLVTGTTISASGNITGASLLGNVVSISGNITGANLLGNVVSVSGNINGNNVITNTLTSVGNIVTATQNNTPNIFRISNKAWLGDAGINDTLLLTSNANAANGYIVFGNANSSQSLGRAGTGPLTYTGDMSLSGNVTANNIVGNFNFSNGDVIANSFTSNNFIGRLISNNLTGSNTAVLIRGNIATNDYFELTVGGTGLNQGFVEFATGDEGTEPIYFRQYTGATLTSNLTLLDGAGNTILNKNLSVPGNINLTSNGNLSTAGNVTANRIFGTLSASVSGTNSANIVQGTMAGTDAFRIQVGGTASDQGFLEIATADNGNEPIYVRQYTIVGSDPFGGISREVIILDANGNSLFPGVVTATGGISSSGNLNVTSNINITGSGNLRANGNIFANNGSVVGDVVQANVLNTNGYITANQYISVGPTGNTLLWANGFISTTGSISSLANISAAGNISLGGNISATGNLTGNRFIGNTVSITGTATAASLVGDLTANNSNVGNRTGTTLSVSGNVTGNLFISNGTGTGNNYRVGNAAWLGDITDADTVRITGIANPANGFIVFGNGNNAAKLGRNGVGALTYTGNMSATGTITANNFVGNFTFANSDVNANSFSSNNFFGGNFVGKLTVNALTGTSNAELIRANIATSDFFALTVGGTAADAGFAAFDVGDNGNEQIFFRQFTGASPTRTLTLLDPNGNTILPNNLSVTSNITTTADVIANNFVGNLSMSVAGGVVANVINTTVAGSDYFRIQIGGNTDQGYVSIDTANEGTEPIYVRQYISTQVNPYNALNREVVLLSNTGNSVFPGTVSIGGGISVTGAISAGGSLSVPNLSVSGNIVAAAIISATGNIIGSSNLSVVSGITAGSILSSGTLSANGNITTPASISATGLIEAFGNMRTSANLCVVGNIANPSGNITSNNFTGNAVSVTGNVTAANLVGNLTATSAVITSATGTSSSVTGNVTGNIIISSATGSGNNFRVGTTTWIGDIGVTETLMISGQSNVANGYVVFGNGNNSAKLGRAGTGPLTYSGDMSLSGNITANNLFGNVTISGDLVANNFTANNFIGGNIRGLLTTANLTGTTNANIILSNIADSDYFRVVVGGTSTDNGFVSFETGDNGNEPIYFRQYNGLTARTLTLLDGTGNTNLPGSLSVVGSISTANNINANNITANTFTGNLQITLSGTNTASILNTVIADNDYFRIQVGGSSSNAGFVSFDTANEGTEPIFVRQYTESGGNPYGAVARSLTLLDSGGNTQIPGNLSVTGAITSASSITVTSVNGTVVTPGLSTTMTANALSGIIAGDDYYRIQVGGTGANSGFISIDTADNGNEPIYVRQYTNSGGNPFGTLTRTLTLLDASGDTNLPGNLNISGAFSNVAIPAGGNARIGYRISPIQQKNSSYTLAVDDSDTLLYFVGQPGGTLLNIQSDSTVVLPFGTQIRLINGDASQNVTVTPAVGVTLRYQGTTGARTLAAFADTTLVKVAANTWYIDGWGIS